MPITGVLPRFAPYGPNAVRNALRFEIGDLAIWFSYGTPVAFQKLGEKVVVRKNNWGTTTGKHLNWIDGGDRWSKEDRIDSTEFERLIKEAV